MCSLPASRLTNGIFVTMSHAYPTPASPCEAEIEIKKSRFIARALKVHDRSAALNAVEQIRIDYPDARHYCWAYLLGNPQSATSAAMSDDGEPSGTAGKPILNVLQHKGVGDVLVIVVRYFGGIKLGAGGLVRAYGGAAEAVMSMLPTEQAIAMNRVTLMFDFAQEQALRHWAGLHGMQIDDVDYAQRVRLSAELPKAHVATLLDYCAGRNISITVASEESD